MGKNRKKNGGDEKNDKNNNETRSVTPKGSLAQASIADQTEKKK